MVPPAPTVLSTITVWPRGFRSASARSRAILSLGPPAANGTTSVTGLSGKSAQARVAVPARTKPPTQRNRVFMILSPWVRPASGRQRLHLAVQVRLALEADAG